MGPRTTGCLSRRVTGFNLNNDRLYHGKDAIKSIDFAQKPGELNGICSGIINIPDKERYETLGKGYEPSNTGSYGKRLGHFVVAVVGKEVLFEARKPL